MHLNLEGVYTAMVTPFKEDSLEVDCDQLETMTEWQIKSMVDGLVVVGTTGESPTLTVNERKLVISTVIQAAKGRVPVIAGTGSSSTKQTIEMTTWAKQAGVDACLVVCPYYNKPTQEGIYRHYAEINKVGIPIILYSIPSRTGGVGILPETAVKLSELSNIIGIKEASGNLNNVSHILRNCNLVVLSGEDSLTLPMMSIGAKGVISVTSNISPHNMIEIVHPVLEDDFLSARSAHLRHYSLMQDMVLETNPIPVKFCAKLLGLMPSDACRLPLTAASKATKAILHKNLDGLTFLEEKTPKDALEVSDYDVDSPVVNKKSHRIHFDPLPGAEYYSVFTDVHEERIIE